MNFLRLLSSTFYLAPINEKAMDESNKFRPGTSKLIRRISDVFFGARRYLTTGAMCRYLHQNSEKKLNYIRSVR